MTADNWKELSPVGLWAALAHAFSVLALGAGAVSFGQIVKAGEPVFAAATNALLLKVFIIRLEELIRIIHHYFFLPIGH
jgi:hypothetical protein